MTNSYGKGTTNIGVNLVIAEKEVLGKLAFMDARSVGDFIRRMCLNGLRIHNPEAAAKIEQIRRKHSVSKL
jgi:hypothetical protein